MIYFIKAWLIGFAIAAPIGPIGLLCIKETLHYGVKGGLLVGVGAALADCVYAVVAAAGLSAVTNFLVNSASHIKVIGGFILLYLALQEFRSTSAKHAASVDTRGLKGLVPQIFILTLTNPMTILSYLAVFASFSFGVVNFVQLFAIILGVFLGAMSWWLILANIVRVIQRKLSADWIQRIRNMAAVLLGVLAILAIWSGFRDLWK